MIMRPTGRCIAVTGATGFIGDRICQGLEARGDHVRRIVRRRIRESTDACIADIGPDTDWRVALDGIDCVIHTAGRAHVLKEDAPDPLAEFRRVNTAGTRRLVEEAAKAGVRRVVFVSTVGVLGTHTNGRAPFDERSAPAPVDPYALSKLEAELAVQEVARDSGLEPVIVRPPLVYGAGAPGNFARLLRLASLRLPLPVGLVDNLRSLVGIDNLVDLLILCTTHPAAAGQQFLVSDDHDMSTPDLLSAIRELLGRRSLLLPIPPALLRAGGRLIGRLPEVDKLIGSLQVDISHTRRELDWSPPVSTDEGLRRAVGSSSP